MSDLQLSLLALGAVIIAGVILFNWWQERRFMQESIRRFDGPADDALMEEFHIDPTKVDTFESVDIVEERFDDPKIAEDAMLEDLQPAAVEERYRPAAPEITPSREEFAPEPVAEPEKTGFAKPDTDEMQVAETAPAPPPEEVKPHPIVSTMPADVDEQIDLIGLAQLPTSPEIAALQQAVQQLPKFDKPVHWFLQDDAGFWHALNAAPASNRYIQMVAALQLADRSGPVSQGTLLAFREHLANLASSLNAPLEWRGVDDPLRYATELDQFCIDVDVMVGFHIMQGVGGSFAGTKLRGLAEANGMKLHDDGAFHFEDANGRTLFSLVSQDQRPFKAETLRTVFYRGVSFQLDVPRVEHCADAFNRMVLFARQLETGLEATLVDDNQRALGDAEIDKIRQQLKMINARMVARSILPGTPTALRLFS